MVAHCILFWGKDVIKAYKSTRQGKSEDRHHQYMAEHYKETPAWWYGVVLLISFIFGLVVVLKENITLPVWAYIVSLLLGMAFGPFVSQDYLFGVNLLTLFVEHSFVCSIRERYRYKQSVKVGGWSPGPWTPRWQYVLCCLVAQRYNQYRQSVQ